MTINSRSPDTDGNNGAALVAASQTAGASDVASSASRRADGSVDIDVIPVIEERLEVATRLTDAGRGVRIHKAVTETPHTVEQPLLHDELQVQRLPQDRILDASDVPQARYEGDTLVIPVVEEVLVVQKQLRLTEEIRITRVRTPVMSTQTVVLKSERVELERFEEPGARSDGGRPQQ